MYFARLVSFVISLFRDFFISFVSSLFRYVLFSLALLSFVFLYVVRYLFRSCLFISFCPSLFCSSIRYLFRSFVYLVRSLFMSFVLSFFM